MPSFLIYTPYTFFGDWMAFGLCYSIKKLSPESNIMVKPQMTGTVSKQYFNWVSRLSSKIDDTKEIITIESPNIIAIRPFSDELDFKGSCSEAKEDKFTPFVSYQNGCGKFVMADWIDKEEYPFPYADYFMSEDICVNEIQILKLWKQMNVLYPLLARG